MATTIANVPLWLAAILLCMVSYITVVTPALNNPFTCTLTAGGMIQPGTECSFTFPGHLVVLAGLGPIVPAIEKPGRAGFHCGMVCPGIWGDAELSGEVAVNGLCGLSTGGVTIVDNFVYEVQGFVTPVGVPMGCAAAYLTECSWQFESDVGAGWSQDCAEAAPLSAIGALGVDGSGTMAILGTGASSPDYEVDVVPGLHTITLSSTVSVIQTVTCYESGFEVVAYNGYGILPAPAVDQYGASSYTIGLGRADSFRIGCTSYFTVTGGERESEGSVRMLGSARKTPSSSIPEIRLRCSNPDLYSQTETASLLLVGSQARGASTYIALLTSPDHVLI